MNQHGTNRQPPHPPDHRNQAFGGLSWLRWRTDNPRLVPRIRSAECMLFRVCCRESVMVKKSGCDGECRCPHTVRVITVHDACIQRTGFSRGRDPEGTADPGGFDFGNPGYRTALYGGRVRLQAAITGHTQEPGNCLFQRPAAPGRPGAG